MGFGIFKKIKNGNKSVAGRLKKKVNVENPEGSFTTTPKKKSIRDSGWEDSGWGSSNAWSSRQKINSDFPDLRFK